MEDTKIRITRSGICMGDDAFEHVLSISFSYYDNVDMIKLLKIIDLWLIEVGDVVWTITLGGETVLGLIKVINGKHIIEVCEKKHLSQLDFSKDVFCRPKYIR